MKKIIAFLMAVVMCLGMVACGSNNSTANDTGAVSEAATEAKEAVPTKEEMLAVAEKVSAGDIQNDSVNNVVKAKQLYCNKTLLLSGTVRNILEDHIEVSALYSANYIIDVYLSVDELVKLEKQQYIEVVGMTTDELVEDSETAAGYTFEYTHYQMPAAYFVNDRLEITGKLKGVNNSYAPAFNVQIGNNNVLMLVYFADGVDTSAFTFGQEITFSAKPVEHSNGWHYLDAKIVE